MEVTHSVKEALNLSCGCALVTHPSAFASVSVSYFIRNYLGFVMYIIVEFLLTEFVPAISSFPLAPIILIIISRF